MIYDKFGQIPSIDDEMEKVSCYQWQNIIKQPNKRLHAKIILFKDQKRREYCLFGSANATNAGLGIKNADSFNVEASIFTKGSSGEMSEVLGIEFDDVALCTTDKLPDSSIPSSQPHQSKSTPVIIKYAEQHRDKLKLLLSKHSLRSSLDLTLYDSDFNEIETKHIQIEKSDSVTIPVKNSIQFLKISDQDNQQGQTVFVNSRNKLIASNPSSKYELISSTIQGLELGDISSLSNNFSKLLDEFSISPQKVDSPKSSKGSKQEETEKDESKSDEYYHKDEFKEKSPSSSLKKDTRADYLVTILDVLFSTEARTKSVDTEFINDNVNNDYDSGTFDEEIEGHREEKITDDDEWKKRLNGYYSYFDKVLNYYESFTQNLGNKLKQQRLREGNNISKKDFYKQKLDKSFILLWLLNLSLAHKVIKEFSVKNVRSNEWLNSQPFASGRTVSVNKFIKVLLPHMIGYLRIGRIKISKYLDIDSRLKTVSAIITLLNLKHWPKDQKGVYEKICYGILEVFDLQKDSEIEQLTNEINKRSQLFLDKDFREFDQFSFNNFRKNMGLINNIL